MKIWKILNRRVIFNRFYTEKRYGLDNGILISGTGRSGTTWLAEILSKSLNYRLIFEPFHPKRVKMFRHIPYKVYLPPDFKSEKYYNIFKQILSGEVQNSWINRDNHINKSSGRIIKTIRASLFLKWLRNNFPKYPIIYILRHPCAVVASRLRLNWEPILINNIHEYESLISNHLDKYIDLINDTKTILEKTTCIWCIENLVVLNTMQPDDFLITTYENLVANPNNEVKRIFNYIEKDSINNIDDIIINKVSITARKDSAILKNKDPLKEWKTNLSEKEVETILEIVRNFNLDFLYDESFKPKLNF